MATKRKNKKKKAKEMKITLDDFLKANRIGSREAEIEQNNTGWKAKRKVHKNKKAYSRKNKKNEKY